MQQDTNFLEDLLASLEVELEKADMIVTMIQRDDHTSSIHPMDIKRWAAERERVWVYIDILGDYIHSVLQAVTAEKELVGN